MWQGTTSRCQYKENGAEKKTARKKYNIFSQKNISVTMSRLVTNFLKFKY